MKKILNGPTVWRAKCPYCDCKLVKCPGCNRYLHHKKNPKSHTEVKKEDTMTT